MKIVCGNQEGYNINTKWAWGMGGADASRTVPFYCENITNTNETISIKKSANSSFIPTITIEYSTDKINWNTLGSTSYTALTYTLTPGSRVYLRCSTTGWSAYSNNYNLINGCSKIGGNLMSLLYGSSFEEQVNFPQSVTGRPFDDLFYNNTKLIDASELIMPNDTKPCCYYGMFNGCSKLTTAPVLPATSLTSECYRHMFKNCSSLTTAPTLPATTLATNCYYGMFEGCTSLTTSPELPATTLFSSCYYGMFVNCTGLITAGNLSATTLAASCCMSMFTGCSKLTTAPTLPATTLENDCYRHMFKNCSSLTATPTLPATALAQRCYYGMFEGCTSLTSTTTLPATTLTSNCYYGMFYNCSGLTTAPVLPATTLVEACYRVMFLGCSKLAQVKCHATNISASNCLYSWLQAVAASGTFYKDANTTYPTGGSGIPSGWTVVDL